MDEKVISVAEMRAADRYTIDELGVPSIELMRRAAQGVFDAVEEERGWSGSNTVIFCGSGNNGGDGYALAEIMKDRGMDPLLVRVSEKFSDDGRYYFERCMEKDVRCVMFDSRGGLTDDADIIVDCMLGTGFAGVPRGSVADAIGVIGRAREDGAYIVCVDINSGMTGDTGEAETAIKSDLTVSIGYLKTGFFTDAAKPWIGKLVNADIGIELP